jgi:predicted ATPase/class 3 adenylate cyclase/DNA-binding XRE family transcriptional regulator
VEAKSFGEWLRHRRRELDLTQEELARQVGCAPITVRKIESEQMRPSKQLAELLLQRLAVPAEHRARLVAFARGKGPGVSMETAMAGEWREQGEGVGAEIGGERRTAETYPTGTVTFLFTDIVGSTNLAAKRQDVWEDLRRRHHGMLAEAIGRNNGYVFQIIGDGFCAAFHNGPDAIRAAVQAQRALQAANWSETPVRVRMGIHTGSADLQSDGQYLGYLALSRVSRLMSAGHGEQVLLSQATEELVRDELPEGVGLLDLGERRLRDLIRGEHIYQVMAENLSAEFPPLKTLDLYLHNLPVQLTTFIGREREIREVKESLSGHRLVTLTGSAGTGKTRLSLQVAADVLDQFHDGVWFVELAPVADAGLVLQAVASVFNLREEAGRSLESILKDYLREKGLLLVLDNCEHLVAACAQLVDALLRACPNLKILASSREPLRIEGEAVYRVPGLSLPNPKVLPAIDVLSQFEAVRLFIDRAQLVQPSFAVTNLNAPAVAQICHRLDGIPLALELAAARLSALQVEDVQQRLDDRFRLLTGGSRMAMPHHQTLRATIDWSYELLSEAQRLLLRRLSVFVGGWTLAAAEVVCASEGLESFDVLDLLSGLVAKSLVLAEDRSGGVHYRMLESVSKYAQEKIGETGETNRLRDRHLLHFAAWAEQVAPKLRSAEQIPWMERMEAEHDNIRSALEWSLSGGDRQAGLRLAVAASWFWYPRSYWREGLTWLRAILDQVPQEVWTSARAKAFIVAGSLALEWSPRDPAADDYNGCLEYLQKVADDWWVAYGLGVVGWSFLYSKDPVAGRTRFEEAVAFARKTEDDWLLGWSLRGLAAAVQRTDILASRPILEECMLHVRAAGDRWALGETLNQLTGIPLGQGDYASAAALAEENLRVYREIQDRTLMHAPLANLMYAMLGLGNVGQAGELIREYLQLARNSGYQSLIAYGVIGHGYVAGAEGRQRRCVTLLTAGEALLNAIGMSELSFPIWRALYERCFATARERLGKSGFSQAMALGQAMTLETAVRYALEVPGKSEKAAEHLPSAPRKRSAHPA